MLDKQEKIRHNYTSELELKSLLIRIKNERSSTGTLECNSRINKYIKWHTTIGAKKYEAPQKRNIVKSKLKEKIVALSERTQVDKRSYERFGEIILLMIKKILTKPQFSGYTYKDDFYSDAVYKILKYLDNFDHELISERTGLNVNAFAYISQIIHNSILFIINTKKKELENHKKQVQMEVLNHNLQLSYDDWYAEPAKDKNPTIEIIERVELHEIRGSLTEELLKLQDEIDKCTRMEIVYPKTYLITFDEYNDLKGLLKGKVSILRGKKA
jgi:DNA-directed RNA polymerase specialized sigma24 family protein